MSSVRISSSLVRLVIIACIGLVWASGASAQIVDTRHSSANPMVEIFKSTIYGGLAGIVLGSALELAIDNDDGGEYVKWGFVGGTFFGFGFGVYHVQTRGQPRALLEGGTDGWAFAIPTVTMDHVRGEGAAFESPISAAASAGPSAFRVSGDASTVHIPLASYRF